MRSLLLLVAACQLADAVFWTMVSDYSQYPPHRADWDSIYKGVGTTCRYAPSGVFKGGHVWEGRCEVADNGRKTKSWPFEVVGFEPTTENMYWQDKISGDMIRNNGVQLDRGSNNFVCAMFTFGQGTVDLNAGTRKDKCYSAGFKTEQDVCEFGFPCAQGLLVQLLKFYDISNVHYNLNDIEEIGSYSKYGTAVEYTNSKESRETVVLAPRMKVITEANYEMDQQYYDGTDMKVTAGLPVYNDGKWEITAEETHQITYGQTMTSTVEYGAVIEVEIPPRSKCSVRMFGLQKRVNVPYTAHANNSFPDGRQVEGDVTGMYHGLPVDEVKAEVTMCQNLDSGEMSAPQYTVLSKF